jgi:hypothetical protein
LDRGREEATVERLDSCRLPTDCSFVLLGRQLALLRNFFVFEKSVVVDANKIRFISCMAVANKILSPPRIKYALSAFKTITNSQAGQHFSDDVCVTVIWFGL